MGPEMSSGPRTYFDTNVFITAFESAGARSDHAWWLLDAIEAGEFQGSTSEITLAELLVKPLEENVIDLVESYKQIIRPTLGFDVLPISRDVLIQAATIRAGRKSVKLPDAVHVATAQQLGCTFFVSGDRRLELLAGMRQLVLGPLTLDDIVGTKA